MKEAKEITASISERYVSFDFAIKDKDLIETVFSALTEFVKNDSPVKIQQTYMNSPSDSVKVISKIVSKDTLMIEWRNEVKQLISILQKRG